MFTLWEKGPEEHKRGKAKEKQKKEIIKRTNGTILPS